MLLKGKHEELKMKDGKPVEPFTVECFLDFSPNHYKLPVSAYVYAYAFVGNEYELDLTGK